MPGPGEYLPDATEGITDPKDLPKPKIIRAAATSPNGHARIVGTAPIGIAKESGSCTIWEIWSRVVHAMSI